MATDNNNVDNNKKIIIIIIITKGTGVGQVGASAYHMEMDAPAEQSLGWHLWQVPVTPSHLRWDNNTG